MVPLETCAVNSSGNSRKTTEIFEDVAVGGCFLLFKTAMEQSFRWAGESTNLHEPVGTSRLNINREGVLGDARPQKK